MTELGWIQLKLKKIIWGLGDAKNRAIRKLRSLYFTNTIKQSDREAWQVYQFGVFIIDKYNKYTNYTPTQAWAVGLGMLDVGYDIRDYDPAKYSGIELLVLALQSKFKDIGGPNTHTTRYIDLLKIYYPNNTEEVLRLVVMSMMTDNPMTPVVISDIYHPTLETLLIQAAGEIGIKSDVYTDSQLAEIQTMISETVYTLITDIQDNILKRPKS